MQRRLNKRRHRLESDTSPLRHAAMIASDGVPTPAVYLTRIARYSTSSSDPPLPNFARAKMWLCPAVFGSPSSDSTRPPRRRLLSANSSPGLQRQPSNPLVSGRSYSSVSADAPMCASKPTIFFWTPGSFNILDNADIYCSSS